MITLGLDLGISSIGWAILSETYQKRELIAWGSRIFEPGVEGTDNEISAGKGVSRCAPTEKGSPPSIFAPPEPQKQLGGYFDRKRFSAARCGFGFFHSDR